MRQMLALDLLKGRVACPAGFSRRDATGAREVVDVIKALAMKVEEIRYVRRGWGWFQQEKDGDLRAVIMAADQNAALLRADDFRQPAGRYI